MTTSAFNRVPISQNRMQLQSMVVLALSLNIACATAKDVFAHYIVGSTAQYTQADWLRSVQQAARAGIDGFALNIGADSYTNAQLTNAFNAADQHGNGFKLFISF